MHIILRKAGLELKTDTHTLGLSGRHLFKHRVLMNRLCRCLSFTPCLHMCIQYVWPVVIYAVSVGLCVFVHFSLLLSQLELAPVCLRQSGETDLTCCKKECSGWKCKGTSSSRDSVSFKAFFSLLSFCSVISASRFCYCLCGSVWLECVCSKSPTSGLRGGNYFVCRCALWCLCISVSMRYNVQRQAMLRW